MGNPAVYGVNITVPWANIDTGTPGSPSEYDFSGLDAEIQYFTSNYPSKKINLLLMAVNYGNIDNPEGGVNTATPSYVFTTSWSSSAQVTAVNQGTPAGPQDVAYCSSYPGNRTFTDTTANANTPNFDPTGYPVVYEPPFVAAYENYINAVISHYNSNSSVGYIRFGLSVGDEADAYCTAQMQALPAPNTFVSPNSWENYTQTIESSEKSQNPKMQLMQSLNPLDTTPNLITLPIFQAQTAVSNKFGFGSNGFQKSDIQAASNGARPCTSDWCALFDQYAGQVPLELQTATQSDPTDASNAVGDLAQLIPVAAQNHATILELSLPDLYLGLVSGYQPSNPGEASYSSAYAAALTDPCSQ
jgi:hypothetical protein